ncbi:hypothetical protein BJ508DRAFT_327433 [Ascobolus immersus RN42]|uniref:BZIP domain-containing protein n=1 Tax=Ascobolus immersus RN42 TaxID=1160509 RepID=A0A3N4I2V8_ASCIM|nr:hypothetical protein BJ508DRAFT_327433 [Ascobolus immersus RN42]
MQGSQGYSHDHINRSHPSQPNSSNDAATTRPTEISPARVGSGGQPAFRLVQGIVSRAGPEADRGVSNSENRPLALHQPASAHQASPSGQGTLDPSMTDLRPLQHLTAPTNAEASAAQSINKRSKPRAYSDGAQTAANLDSVTKGIANIDTYSSDEEMATGEEAESQTPRPSMQNFQSGKVVRGMSSADKKALRENELKRAAFKERNRQSSARTRERRKTFIAGLEEKVKVQAKEMEGWQATRQQMEATIVGLTGQLANANRTLATTQAYTHHLLSERESLLAERNGLIQQLERFQRQSQNLHHPPAIPEASSNHFGSLQHHHHQPGTKHLHHPATTDASSNQSGTQHLHHPSTSQDGEGYGQNV